MDYDDGSIIVRCAGIVEKDDEFLLVHSQYDDELFWIFPGGGLEPGERLRDCVKREVLEETGLDVEVEKLVFINETPPSKDSMVHFTYLCTPISSDDAIIGSDPDKEDEVIHDVRYFSIEEIRDLDNFLPPHMKDVFEQAVDNDFDDSPTVF
jgi:8-oxo-dGTP diphosphatase